MARLTRFAAWGACAAAIGYGVPQILQVAGLLPDPIDRILIFAPSLALAPLFAVALASAAAESEAEARPWRFGAAALAVLYAAHVSQVYAIQLGIVIPGEIAGLAPGPFACCGFRQPLTAVDLLGYTEMSLATLLLAPSYRGTTRLWLVLNGLVALVLLPQLWWPELIWAGAAWLVTFPVAMALVARDTETA
jgi:hypothetical protein